YRGGAFEPVTRERLGCEAVGASRPRPPKEHPSLTAVAPTSRVVPQGYRPPPSRYCPTRRFPAKRGRRNMNLLILSGSVGISDRGFPAWSVPRCRSSHRAPRFGARGRALSVRGGTMRRTSAVIRYAGLWVSVAIATSLS